MLRRVGALLAAAMLICVIRWVIVLCWESRSHRTRVEPAASEKRWRVDGRTSTPAAQPYGPVRAAPDSLTTSEDAWTRSLPRPAPTPTTKETHAQLIRDAPTVDRPAIQ